MEVAIIQNDLEFVTNILKTWEGDPLDSLLFIAIDHGRADIVGLLSQYCAIQHDHIYYASERGQVDCVRRLLPHTHMQNICNNNPLAGACKGVYPNGNYVETVTLLVNEFSDLINLYDYDGITPLTIALIHKQDQLAQILLDHNADVDFYNQEDVHLFSYAIHCGNTQIIDNILARLLYPAHISARCGYLPYFEQHQYLDLLDDWGDTVFHNAVYGNQKELVEWFIKQGLDLNVKSYDGCTLLHDAMGLHNPNILEILLKAGANPNIKDNHGQTPLFRSHIDLRHIQLLIDYGADVFVTDNHGSTAKDQIQQYPYHSPDIVEFLENYQAPLDIKEPDIN